ncbi:MAG: cobyric acid synthase [Prevotellaceae bacterium]|nr:cobyric acid synthase [Prevotellaceae bacterium]
MAQHHDRLRPLMLVGTGSDVGKSVLSTALCRIFLEDGYSPAPFKAQNMALNSYATPEGGEIGRAQATQAEACRLEPHTDMNPVLLKPNSEHTTQVVLNGKPLGNRSAYDYFRSEGREALREAALQAFRRLSERYNPIVIEGAGSVSELNLRASDLANMPMARAAGAAVILVADIDRGGVFASCYGSIALQQPEDRRRIRGIIINKFRGDLRLFEEGRRMIENLCHVPVLGVVPFFNDIAIDEEDSVELATKRHTAIKGKVNVAVLLLHHISNFTDFSPLERDPRANLFYTREPKDIEEADILVLPGTKATMDDLLSLRREGLAEAILRRHESGKRIVGVCGGFQMLGQEIHDPLGVEGSIASLPGLGILPLVTTMEQEKTTRQVEFSFRGTASKGYEIHQGRSSFNDPFLEQGNCLGTYIHGFFDNPAVRQYLLGGKPQDAPPAEDFRQSQYDKLAEHVRQHVDIQLIYKILRENHD